MMKLRPLAPKDRDTYLSLAKNFYHSPAVLHPVPDSHFERTFEEILRSDAYAGGFLMENEEGVCMGYVLTSKTFSQECGGMAVWVEELYVLPQFQGQGLGTEALRQLETIYPCATRLRLEVEPDNEGAARLYERLGYKVLGYRQYVKDRF